MLYDIKVYDFEFTVLSSNPVMSYVFALDGDNIHQAGVEF